MSNALETFNCTTCNGLSTPREKICMKPFVNLGFQWGTKARSDEPTAIPLTVECLLTFFRWG
eukprot:scaffold3410_cov141-Cylindrotheca_fusiformis.AAC.37